MVMIDFSNNSGWFLLRQWDHVSTASQRNSGSADFESEALGYAALCNVNLINLSQLYVF